jgi:shikimate kinase
MVDERVPSRPSNRHGVHAGIALVGFMGAGKSTVGRELAQRLGWRFLDLDELIEERERRKIEDIFRRDGEAAFRGLECAAVREATQSTVSGPVVLALGGGAFIDPAVRSCLEEAQIPAIFLDAPVGELFRRSEQPGVNRPLRRHEEQFRRLYERRRPEYLKAAICVETEGKAIASVAQEIISELNLVPFSGACD